MKKIFFMVIIFFAAASFLPAQSGKSMYVWVDNANVRSVPDLKGKVLFVLKEGEKIALTGQRGSQKQNAVLRGKEYENVFYEIVTEAGKKGWIYAPALTEYPLAASRFKLKWKYKIGLTTFRTSLKFFNGSVYAPSNGERRDSLTDAADGVYIIDSVSGKLRKHVSFKSPADNDVNGIGLSDGRMFFGNDDSIVFCYTQDGGKQLWKFRADGDIEGCPVLADFDGDGKMDVAVATENNSVYALNGNSGKLIWKYHDTVISEYEASGFIASPACADINGDGIDDVLIGSRNNIFYAFAGNTGEILWATSGSVYYSGHDEGDYEASDGEEQMNYVKPGPAGITSGIHSSAFIAGNVITVSESYSGIHFFNFDGSRIGGMELSNPNIGIEGLFSSPVTYNGSVYIGSSWWGEDDNVWAVSEDGVRHVNTGTVSSTCVIADITGSGKMEVVFVTEKGELLILDAEGNTIDRMKLPGGAEATPLVQDVDKDGKLELLVACLDGNLYCYETDSSGKVYCGQFRGNLRNTGTAR